MINTRGAVLFDTTERTRNDWQVVDLQIGDPKVGEVLIRVRAAGLCHSDAHAPMGDQPTATHPWLSGHEGAGIVEKVGEGVTHVEPGDHVTCTFIPSCGKCTWCIRGLGQLCDRGALLMTGCPLEGTPRVHTADGTPVGQMVFLGSFSPYMVAPSDAVIKIDKDIPFPAAAVMGCAVPTGWGTAVNIAEVEIDDVVVVIGLGGVGMNAVQGARDAGARTIVAVDIVPSKLDRAGTFGATHTAGGFDEAFTLVQELTDGRMADKVILTVGRVDGDMIQPSLNLLSKGGTMALAAVSGTWQTQADWNILPFVLMQQTMKGGIYGGCLPHVDIPRLLDRYKRGELLLDELITRTYTLDEINDALRDMESGENIRGVIVFD